MSVLKMKKIFAKLYQFFLQETNLGELTGIRLLSGVIYEKEIIHRGYTILVEISPCGVNGFLDFSRVNITVSCKKISYGYCNSSDLDSDKIKDCINAYSPLLKQRIDDVIDYSAKVKAAIENIK